jgi:hypothetical protein
LGRLQWSGISILLLASWEINDDLSISNTQVAFQFFQCDLKHLLRIVGGSYLAGNFQCFSFTLCSAYGNFEQAGILKCLRYLVRNSLNGCKFIFRPLKIV